MKSNNPISNTGKSMIKLNPLWEEVPLSKKDKKNYKKSTGLNAEKAYMMKEEWWKKLTDILSGE